MRFRSTSVMTCNGIIKVPCCIYMHTIMRTQQHASETRLSDCDLIHCSGFDEVDKCDGSCAFLADTTGGGVLECQVRLPYPNSAGCTAA